MNNLQVTARFQIHEGQLQAFKKLAEECLAIVREKDRRTQQCDWFISVDNSEVVLRETYPDSDALLEHLANIGSLFGDLLQLGSFRAELYGTPSASLLKAISGLEVRCYHHY